jgi:primosomal protein N'
MISYKKWQSLNENFGMPITLGLGSRTNTGIVGAYTNFEDSIEEAKKKEKEEVVEKDEEVDEKEDKKDKKWNFQKKDEKEEVEKEDEKDDNKKDKKWNFQKKGKKAKKEDKEEKCECGEKDCKKCNKKELTKEDQEWWNSLHSQVNSDLNPVYYDGVGKFDEEALIPPQDPNAALIDNSETQQVDPNNAQPGQVGFSPYSRIGWFN